MMPSSLFKFAFIFFFISVTYSCANYKLNYAKGEEKWALQSPNSNLNVRHSIYLIGDTGNAKKGKTIPHFKFLKQELDKASEENSIVFLGDNIYPVGMPSKSNKAERELAEHKLDVQLEMLENFKGNIMFIPGNHDWSKYGLKGLQRQERYINKKLNILRNGTDDKDDKEWEEYFMPSKGCGDPEVVEINDQLVMVLIDSEWWLRNWDSDQSINAGCEIKTRAGFYREFENIVRKYRNRNVMIAMHHPLYSKGQHGGHYTFDNHIFPLRFFNKSLYIPLPGIGTGIAFFRSTVGIQQDLASAKYDEMRDDIMAAITKNGSYIVASGHEHTLQYIKKKNQHFIISGSGSKENAATAGGSGKFAYGRLGYSRLDFYEDGSAWVHFYALKDNQDGMEEVYRKKIKEALEISEDNIPSTFPEFDRKESVKLRKPTNFEFNKVGPLHKLLLGIHYTDIYLKEYPFKVLDLSTFRGGMTPIKRGGGNQTNSLRLADQDGRQFAMRALTKDASRALPYPINQISIAKNILQDNFMSAFPFAALMVPDMAEAAGIYHTNPQLYYVPKQPNLDIHNDLFGGDVYLIEERPGGDWNNLESFGNSEKIISTLDVIEKITKNRKHKVDQSWVIRSRLFDLLIKDWDRHEDQWRWATFDIEDGTLYRPIPRDRDQAFSKYDGIVSAISRAVNPFMRQLQTFSPDVKNIKWESWNSTYFDQTFISELEWEDWEKEAKYIQDNVTDKIIETAFSKIPEAAKDDDWKQMLDDVKKRRDNLVTFARMSYKLKSEIVDILGTDKRDLFEINRVSDTQTTVKVFELSKKGKKKDLAYQRTFKHDVTKEIHLYGMADDDVFKVVGSVDRSLKVRIIGGIGKDEVTDKSYVKKGGKKTIIYDSSEKENDFNLGRESKDKSSESVSLNTYDRRSFHYDPSYWINIPAFEFYPDDGLVLGFNSTYYHHIFKKSPYGQKHNFKADYSLGTNALNFNYSCQFIEAVKKWDLLTNVGLRRNRYAFNYFGFGNNTSNPDPDNLDFNRVRQSKIYLDLLLNKRFINNQGNFSFGPFIERTRIEDTPNRFISSTEDVLPADIFQERIYTGTKVSLEFQNLDQIINPQKGVKFHIRHNFETNLNNSNLTFNKFDTGLSIYKSLDAKGTFVFATQLRLQAIFGEYDFFKAPSIGGLTMMRGFRAQRFRGDTAFSQGTDIRIKLLSSINKVLPFTLGIHGGFDYGRVWEEGVESNKIHTSYGGGIWLDPIDFLVISFGQYYSEEDRRFIFKLAHMF